MITPASSQLVFKYLALPYGIGARGGVERFFMLSQNIPFAEQLFAMGDVWAEEKKRLVTSGENPSATVPVIYATSTDDDKTTILPQHIATARFLARVYEVGSGDDYKDYVQDLVGDEYQGFRDQWVKMSFEASDDEKATYQQEVLPKQLTKFNSLYKQFKTHDTFLSVSKKTSNPLWGDAAMFGLLRDFILTGHMTLDDLKQYSYLFAMYEAYEKIPSIAEWIEKKQAELAA